MNFIDGHAGTLVFNIDAVYGNNVLLHKDTPYIIKLADPQNFQKVDNSLETELETNNDNVTAGTISVENCLRTSDCVFASNDIKELPASDYSSADVFADPANHDFTLKINDRIGDPRWFPVE